MVSHDRPTVRFLRSGDEGSLLAHLEATFGRWPGLDLSVPPIDHLRWKLSSDSSVSSCNVVAEAGSRIVGALLFVGQRVKTRTGELLAAHGADWSVQPEYQGQGLMVAMRTLAIGRLKGRADFNPGQSGHAAVNALNQREGNRPICNGPQRFVLRLSGADVRVPGACSITTVTQFDERADHIWSEVSQSFDYIGVRDRRWLAWRYCDKRAGDFVVRLAEENGQLLGYCVYRTSQRRDIGYIVDLLTLLERGDIAEALIHDALAAFRRQQLAAAECWLPIRHPYRPAIDAAGFVPRSKRLRLIYRALRAPDGRLSFLEDRNAAVHFMIGDSDVP